MTTTATLMLENLFEHTSEDIVNFTIASSHYAVLEEESQDGEPVVLQMGYERGEKVAEGGMSNIYLGYQRTLDRRVAIKENKRAKNSYNEVLIHESRITARLEHPNIMPIYDITQTGEQFQVVLKWLEGFTLAEKLEEWRDEEMEIDLSVPVLLKVCDALTYAHEQGILHRDIKSENIMIGDHGAIYLLDWGIALDINHPEGSPNMVVGTLSYMAPEMLTDAPLENVSERSDIFLLGATLHEVLTGERRHSAPTPSAVVQQILACEPYLYPPELTLFGDICNKACHKDPAKRYKSMRSFAHALQGALDVWKQRFLLDQGLAMLEELEAIDQGAFVPETNSHIFQLYMQTRSAFGGYMLLDSTNPIANDGLRAAGLIMLRHCIAERELTSARWMLESISDVPSDLQEAVLQLEAEILAKVEEDRIINTVSEVTQQISQEVSELNRELHLIQGKQQWFVMAIATSLFLLAVILYLVASNG